RASKRIHRHFETRIEIPCFRGIELFLNLALAFEQLGHFVIGHGLAEFRVDLIKLAQEINNRLHTLFDDFPNRLARIKTRFLFEVANSKAGRYSRLALKFLIDAGKNPQQRALTGSVESDDTDFGAIEVRQIDVLEDRFLVVEL